MFLIPIEGLVECIEKTFNTLNTGDMIKYSKYLGTGANQKIIEVELLHQVRLKYPDAEYYHPKDNNKENLQDIYSEKENAGCEIKACQAKRVRWRHSTIKSGEVNFLFIRYTVDDNGIYHLEYAFYGPMKYEDWSLDKSRNRTSLYVLPSLVSKCCKQII